MSSILKHMLNFVKFHPVILKILGGNEILTRVKGHNFFKNLHKSTHDAPNLDLVIINAYANYYQILLICIQNI